MLWYGCKSIEDCDRLGIFVVFVSIGLFGVDPDL